MASDSFDFKRFSVCHSLSTMKVGTDGVLLGAWAGSGAEDVERVDAGVGSREDAEAVSAAGVCGAGRILDIGTGSGVVALMLAQRFEAQGARVVGVDIDESSCVQARENIAASPWSDRVEVVCGRVQEYMPREQFDLIVSNPPFFVDSLKCPDGRRSLARHTDSLTFEELAASAARLLREGGALSVVIPTDVEEMMSEAAREVGMALSRRVEIYTKQGAVAKRVLLEYRKGKDKSKGESGEVRDEKLFIRREGEYSEEYVALTKDFYLMF